MKLVKLLSGSSDPTTDTTPGTSSSSIRNESTIRGGSDIAAVSVTLEIPAPILEAPAALASAIRDGDDIATVGATLKVPDVQTPISEAAAALDFTIRNDDDVATASATLETPDLQTSIPSGCSVVSQASITRDGDETSVSGVPIAQASGQFNARTTIDLPPSANRAVDQFVGPNEDTTPTSLCTVNSVRDDDDNATVSRILEVADLQSLNQSGPTAHVPESAEPLTFANPAIKNAHPHTQPQTEFPRLNKYESLIAADKHSVMDDPFLLRTPYIVNTMYAVLICVVCKYSIAPEKALKHARQRHAYCKVSESFVTELKNRYPELKSEKIHPGCIARPVFGLAVSGEPYEVCSRCLHGYSNRGSLRRHVCENPEKDLQGGQPSFSSLVQTFFREPKICYFPIESPVKKEADDFTLFRSQFSTVEEIKDEITNPTEYRELDQFLFKEGWISHVVGHSASELSTLTCLPGQDEVFGPIRHELFLLMSRIQSIIGTAGFHIRRLLGRRPS